MNNLFPPEFRTASVVKRWSIVRTLQPDSVAEHSFNVAFYTVKIANLVKWAGPMADLMFCALLHDIEEVLTGDLVSPVKKAMIDLDKLFTFVETESMGRLPMLTTQVNFIEGEEMWGNHIKALIKVADKVDAVLFIIGEMKLGNTTLGPLFKDAEENLRTAWEVLGRTLNLEFEMLWDNELWPAIQSHWKAGGIGMV